MAVAEEVSTVGAAGADGAEVVAIVEAAVPSEDQFGGVFPSEWIMALWFFLSQNSLLNALLC
jgi:hypothetical protein